MKHYLEYTRETSYDEKVSMSLKTQVQTAFYITIIEVFKPDAYQNPVNF